jgi:hypothetical protein
VNTWIGIVNSPIGDREHAGIGIVNALNGIVNTPIGIVNT